MNYDSIYILRKNFISEYYEIKKLLENIFDSTMVEGPKSKLRGSKKLTVQLRKHTQKLELIVKEIIEAAQHGY
jgi:hypothetical protein